MLESRAMQFLSRFNQSVVCFFVLALFTLQAVVPVGYMPAPASSGSLVQFCPDNVPAELMAILHPGHNGGDEHADHQGHHSAEHHSHHLQHSHHGHHLATKAESHTGPGWSADCDYGALSPSLFATDTVVSTNATTALQQAVLRYRALHFLPLHLWRQNPGRAPPLSIS